MSFFAALALLPLALGGLTAGTTFTISPSSHPDYCLAPASATEGADLVLKKCDASSDIVFTLDGDNLKNTETNMCVDIRDGENQSGTLAQLWGCYDNNPNQQFDVLGDEVKWVGRDKCLDLKDGLGAEGTEIQIWSCYGHNDNQRWTFTEAEEVDGEDCETGSPTTSPTSSPSSTAPASDSDDPNDDDDLPYCDESTSDVSKRMLESRRGRGQQWQRSLDEEFGQLDKRYTPIAPAGVPSAQRRSRRRATNAIDERAATATGL